MKKILALLLVAVMVVALFAACNNTTADPTETKDNTPTGDTGATGETLDMSGPYPKDANGNFVYGDTFKDVTVRIVSVTSVEEDDMWFYKEIEKAIGCKVEVVEIEAAVLADKLSAMLAENNLPTIFESFTPVAQVVEYGEQGAFVDVMDPENLEKMPNFAKIFAEDPEVNAIYMQTAAEDGSHYILPTYDSEREVNHYWIYNEVAFKEAGVEWNGQPEGFLQMLRDLKKHFPNSTPLTGGAWQGTLDRMIYTWSVNSSYAAYDWDKEEWYYGATTDAYYDMLNMLLTAYNEGLMNPDMLTQGNAAIQEDMMNREGFLYNSWLDWMVMHNQAFVDGNKVDHEIPTPTPVGPNGKTLELAKYGNSAGTVITAADPAAADAAMAIMNWMYDVSEGQGGWLASVGIEEFLQTKEDGRFVWKDETMPQGNTDINYPFGKYAMFQTSLTVRYAPESPYFSFCEEVQMAQDIGDKIGFFKCPPPLAISDVEMADAYTASQKDIQAMTQEFILENWDRAKFDAWVAEFNDNYAEVMEFLNG